MNKEEIDSIFEAFKVGNYSTILKYADMPEDDVFDTQQLLKAIISKIEKGDYEYFLSKKESEENIGIYIQLICFSSKKEEIKKIAEEYLTPEKIKKYGIQKLSITMLIKATEDIDKYLFKEQDKDDENLTFTIANVIKATGKIDEYLTKEKSLQFGLYGMDRINLIKETGKVEEYLEPEKIREFNINTLGITALVNATGPKDKYLFEWQNKDDKNLRFTIANVIKATGKIEEYLTPENVREFYLGNDDIAKLIKATGNVEKYLFDGQDINDENIRINIANVIKATGKIEKYITTEKRKEFYLMNSDIIQLIKATGKIEEYLTIEKIEEFNFGIYEITDFIKATGNEEKYLFKGQNKDDKNLICTVANVAKVTKQEQKEDSSKKIKLPTNMTTGIEIESEGRYSYNIKRGGNIEGWNCKKDDSLKNGVEVVSPKLTGDTEKDSNSIKNICYILKTCKQEVSERCGGHIHIGADYLTNTNAWINFVEIYGNVENLLYIISNKEGEIPRKGVLEFAVPISSSFERKLENEELKLDTIEDIIAFTKKSQEDNRFFGINFLNLGNEKNTIEFRLSNGTLDANTWIENINLFGGIVKVAQEVSEIQERSKEERTQEQQKMLENFEKLKNVEITQEEKLETLLELVIPEEDRNIYLRRYKINSKLIEQTPKIKKRY